MAWLVKDLHGEYVFEDEPIRGHGCWLPRNLPLYGVSNYVQLPEGSIFKLIGKELTWDDAPVEI